MPEREGGISLGLCEILPLCGTVDGESRYFLGPWLMGLWSRKGCKCIAHLGLLAFQEVHLLVVG